MKILYISRRQETEAEIYTIVTFKTWYGRTIKRVCITLKNCNITYFADSGENIPSQFWKTIVSFINTKEIFHDYDL